jgi:D-aminoacyl-tRNA deacylase
MLSSFVNLIIASKKDEAGMNIVDKLLKKRDWTEVGTFEGNPCYRNGDILIALTNRYHLYVDGIDVEVKKELGFDAEVVIFASKHRSESGLSTLTVHPLGNFSKAEFGGKARTLVPSNPAMMTEAMRILTQNAKKANLPYRISFEATHHGPYLETPTFFIEIGSLEEQWRDEGAGEVLAETILELKNPEYPVAIGVGGGHYAPRFTEVALAKKISFGHMIANYAIENIDEELLEKTIEMTPGASLVYFHRKSMKKPDYRRLKELFSEKGLRPVREADLETLT